MRQIRITRHRRRPGGWRQDPLPPDPRDPDIVRAHQAACRTRPDGPARTAPDAGER